MSSEARADDGLAVADPLTGQPEPPAIGAAATTAGALRPPRIGVTGPDRGGGAAWWFTRLAVALAGGHAVRITPARPHRIDGLHGLIVGGGADVDPALYGQDPLPRLPPHAPDVPLAEHLLSLVLTPLTWAARRLAGKKAATTGDVRRDALELPLIRAAVERGLPVLGICRGLQLLNVAFGGTLHQHLAGYYVETPEVRTVLPHKLIHLVRGSRLEAILGMRRGRGNDARPRALRVNALHRQAIARLGSGLRIAARDANGIVQAIEHARLPLVIGVQWHPEYLPQMPQQRRLFAALVAEARRRRAAPAVA